MSNLNEAFKLLGLSRAENDIKVVNTAFRKMSRKCHPDRNPQESDGTKFIAITDAKELIIHHLGKNNINKNEDDDESDDFSDESDDGDDMESDFHQRFFDAYIKQMMGRGRYPFFSGFHNNRRRNQNPFYDFFENDDGRFEGAGERESRGRHYYSDYDNIPVPPRKTEEELEQERLARIEKKRIAKEQKEAALELQRYF
jgi:DnaJ-class molecular chaperone